MTTFFPKYIFLLAELWMSFSNGLVLQDFFPDVNQNLTKITWAHAVNNQSYLNNTLSDGGINMIEADIVLGKLNGIGNDIPIMGHPPANISDLSLDSFLQQVTAFNVNVTNTTRKGVKLDFKTIEVFEKSVQIVAQFDKGAFPIWINADILRGPINATNTPVNATRFFKAAETFSNSILSVGWTTLYGNTTTGSYDQTQINAMIDTIKANNVMQDITFPVRAGLAAESIDLLVNLTQEIENSTLTIWSSEGDNVNVEHLRELIKTIGINKTYVDVPSDLLSELHLDSLSHSSPVGKLASGVLLVCLIVSIINVFQNEF